ncbi:acetamidase/formamidase family protein [Ancrocorticia sp.]|uniref:acetamidase/formamidase family protein n=1 Tax=Ancrocorticia sp. TaxID=2593684 RepID=UPI003F914278
MHVDYPVDFDQDPGLLTFTFGGKEAVAEVPAPATLSTSTLDAFAGRLDRPDMLPSDADLQGYLNPQTGPFFIPQAHAGDTLAVHFTSIVPKFDFGISTLMHFFGSLTSTPKTPTLQDPLPERLWYYKIDKDRGIVTMDANESEHTFDFAMDPMHGTVGVAPPLGEVHSSLTPGSWGGNMDTPELRQGATCYLGVNVEGAMFSFGDGHARQGEGESCGTAVEAAMDSTVALDVVSGYYTPWPRIETDDYIMTTGSIRPMEDAFRIAHTEMVYWISEITGMSTMDSYQFASQTSLTPIANAVDTVYTVVCKIPKAMLPGVQVYGGVHERLKAM